MRIRFLRGSPQRPKNVTYCRILLPLTVAHVVESSSPGRPPKRLVFETLPEDRAGEFYEEAAGGRSASHHLQAKAALYAAL